MKFDLLNERFSHWFVCLVIIGGCGMLLPALIMMVFGGHFFVETVNAPTFGLDLIAAKLLYGALTFLAFTAVTKARLLEACIDEWMKLNQMHRDSVSRIKYGPAYFRREAASR